MATIDFRALIDSARTKAKGGLTAAELSALVWEFVRAMMAQLDQFSAAGADKKSLLLDGVSQLYDALEPFFPIPLIMRPFWLLFRSTAKAAVLAAVSALIDIWLPDMRAKEGKA